MSTIYNAPYPSNINFFNTNTNQTHTPTVLFDLMGFPRDEAALNEIGVYRIEYHYPECDKYTEHFVPDGDIVFDKKAKKYTQPFKVEALDAETVANIVQQLRDKLIPQIDEATSTAIMAGFDYAINNETLHFSYDEFDQGNFTDAAVACSVPGAPTSITWNGYRNYDGYAKGELVRLTLTAAEFLPLYNAALQHKASKMEDGGSKKAQVNSATTAAALLALAAEWGLNIE